MVRISLDPGVYVDQKLRELAGLLITFADDSGKQSIWSNPVEFSTLLQPENAAGLKTPMIFLRSTLSIYPRCMHRSTQFNRIMHSTVRTGGVSF